MLKKRKKVQKVSFTITKTEIQREKKWFSPAKTEIQREKNVFECFTDPRTTDPPPQKGTLAIFFPAY